MSFATCGESRTGPHCPWSAGARGDGGESGKVRTTAEYGQMFPSYGQIAASAAPFLVLGSVFLAIAAVTWRRLGAHAKWARISVVVIGTVPVVTACFVFANGWYWRVDPNSVAELKFTQLDSESASAGVSRTLSDPKEVARALRSLASAEIRSHERERFADGYVMRIKRKGAPEFSGRYLFVYRRSDLRGAVTVAVPGVSRSVRGMLVDVGEYNAPEFHAWLATTVDPLFAEQNR